MLGAWDKKYGIFRDKIHSAPYLFLGSNFNNIPGRSRKVRSFLDGEAYRKEVA